MARQFLAEELIATIQKNGGFANVESEGTSEDDLLNFLNEESLGIYAEITKLHEDYFVITEQLQTSVDKNKYRIPHRAMFGKLRDIQGMSSQGSYYRMDQIARENMPSYGSLPGGFPSTYFLEGNHICLWPPINTADASLVVSYMFRPGELTYSTNCRQVLSVSPTTGVVVMSDDAPTGWLATDQYDIHDSKSGAGIKNWNITPTTLVGDTITFAATAVDGSLLGKFPVEVGDWVCQAETAALPGIPRELHPILVQAVIVRIMERKDPEAWQVSRQELDRQLARQASVLAMRVEGPGQQISAFANSTFFGH